MSKQFIPVVSAGRAHDADIYSVVVSKPYTITASGDGHLKFWANNVTENDNVKDDCQSVFVHKTGLHHVDVFEDVIDATRIILVATVSFSGEVFFLSVDPSGAVTKLDNVKLDGGKNDTYWAIKWLKDLDGQKNSFTATQTSGDTKIWNFTVVDGVPKFEKHGDVKSQSGSFATCLDVSSSQDLLATGYQNGDVVLAHVESSKPVFTFHNFGLKGSTQSSSAIRSVKFSPLGKLLAVASDSGSYGVVTIYDTVYGENIGSFTIPTHSTHVSVGAYAHDGWVFEVDFNESGESLVSAGYDGKVRVWNIKTREREATISLSPTDVNDEDIVNEEDGICAAVGVKFINKGIRGGAGSDRNDGLVVISLDRGIRWYREAGGI
ncbi:CYFA0S02e00474g1_1 [Cyberlindnera fabianii]|uniref:Antiviral protein SKI8 n=1 Tax=Cyberlindnera fabianii TaxID=36022 RepID=A0A061ASI6_CYBFA|nr:Antiviral protein SKI8 [Cyberlindnera fabianii]CDR38337.1 CYFA0S02e00474g1_1 [Cyberlindnera fabianii]